MSHMLDSQTLWTQHTPCIFNYLNIMGGGAWYETSTGEVARTYLTPKQQDEKEGVHPAVSFPPYCMCIKTYIR
jgi:hypothetical protein